MRAEAARAGRGLLLALLVPGLCAAWGADRAGDARHDAVRFILEKLERQGGEVWQRSGRHFHWHYGFSPEGCVLTVERSEHAVYVLRLPLADAVPFADGPSSLRFACLRGEACIGYEDLRDGRVRRGELASAAVFVMEDGDLPKLHQALVHLHRLCDAPYGAEPFA